MSEKKAGATFADRRGKAEKQRRTFANESSVGNADVIVPKADSSRVPGQNYWVLSYAAPENSRIKCRTVCVKNSGSFATEEQANRQAEIIRNEDPRFDVHVVNMYEMGAVPMPEDIRPLVRKEYTDRFLTRIMGGLQESTKQARKELDERVERDKQKAEAELRKRYGPDYVPATANKTVKEYEKLNLERDDKADSMRFTQRELMEAFSSYMQSTPGKINPDAAGEFMRFIEAKKLGDEAAERSERDVSN
jgi:hypothetical protein